MRNFHKYGIDTHGRTGGKIKTICPECNATRGHKGNKSFSIDLDKGVCYCHHCGYKLYVPDDTEERERQQRKKKNTIGLTNFHHIFAARFSTPPK